MTENIFERMNIKKLIYLKRCTPFHLKQDATAVVSSRWESLRRRVVELPHRAVWQAKGVVRRGRPLVVWCQTLLG
jgi:hypothetical protein